jgi:hypothetical protein
VPGESEESSATEVPPTPENEFRRPLRRSGVE